LKRFFEATKSHEAVRSVDLDKRFNPAKDAALSLIARAVLRGAEPMRTIKPFESFGCSPQAGERLSLEKA
jgi:hypothetical protein